MAQMKQCGSSAADLVSRNLAYAVEPVVEKYRGYLEYLRPGQSRDIYPWHTPEDVVTAAADRLRHEGWLVRRLPYRGSRANYSGGDYYLRVTAPGAACGAGILCRLLTAAQRAACG